MDFGYGFQSYNKVPEPMRLEDHIELPHLLQLMQLFAEHDPEDKVIEGISKYSPTKYEQREPGALNPVEFKDTIAGVLGTRKYDAQLDKLFTKLDTSADGYVDWDEFITYMMLHYRENDYLRTKKEIPFMQEPRIRHIMQNRQENTTKILAIENPTRFVTVNKDGVICFWSTAMQLEKTTFVDEENEDENGQKRRFKMWITDAISMPNCHKIVLASTCRDLRFYDLAGNQMLEDYHLYGLEQVPHCLDYFCERKADNEQAMLMWGDDCGDINILTFKMPQTQLFERSFSSAHASKTRIYMQDLLRHEKFVEHTVIKAVHNELIKTISYIPDGDLIASSSSSAKTSFVCIDRRGCKKAYIFKLAKGVNCFALSKSLNLLVTGTSDHHVRLWNPYVTSRPVAVLHGHYSAVLGVVICEALGQVFSYSSDTMVKVWDASDHTCLQTILVKFPSSLHGHIPDHGPFPLCLYTVTGSPHNCLLVACNDYIAKLPLGSHAKALDDIPRTHAAPLCSAIYNEFFDQVVTGADDSSILVWDMETGAKYLAFTNSHGDEEITCMAFDGNWRRLITGARDGTVKVWNFQNGQNIHKLEAVDETEVTGVLSLTDREYILTVGWSRKITKYDDGENDGLYIEADHSWKGGTLHKDDILCLAYCEPNLLATGSFDGEILVWALETEKLLLRLNARSKSAVGKGEGFRKHSRVLSGSFRRSSRPGSSYQYGRIPAKGDDAPIDKLVFIRERVNNKQTDAAVLVSSQAGKLKWWSLFSRQHLAEFDGSKIQEESVLAMVCDSKGTRLVTGDTQGILYTWDIASYALKQQSEVNRSPPRLVCSWRAHELAVVSIEYIEHKSGNFILTGSADRTARLWASDGKFVGTFGQGKEWNVHDPRTWVYPLTPFCEGYTESHKTSSRTPTEELNDEVSSANAQTKGARLSEEDVSVIQNLLQVPADIRSEAEKISVNDHMEQAIPFQPRSLTTVAIPTDMPNESKMMSPRANTFHSIPVESHKSIIGVRAESELLRSRASRQERRATFGHVDTRRTNRFGLTCCPFQALVMQDINNKILARDLPVTERMIQRGYTSATLDENSLTTMDLSISFDEDTEKRKFKPNKTKMKARLLPAIGSRSNTMVSTSNTN